MQINERIRELRKEARMSQKELADKVNVGQATISSWEKGRTEPSMEDMYKIAKAFNCSISKLVSGDADTFIDSEIKNTIDSLNENQKKELLNFAVFLLNKKQ